MLIGTKGLNRTFMELKQVIRRGSYLVTLS